MNVNYNITNNLDGIKNAITRKVMAKTVSKITGNNEAVNEVACSILSVSYEGIKEGINYAKDPVVAATLESYVDTIDNLMANYVAKNKNQFIVATEAKDDVTDDKKSDDEDDTSLDAAFDDKVADDVMKNEGGDELSDVVSDIIETAIQGTRDQMKQAVRLALKLEKDKQEEKYNDDKEDADEFDEMTPDDPEAEKEAEQSEGENPFDESGEEGEDKSQEGIDSEGGDDSGSSNPFDESSPDESGDGANPFDESGDTTDETEKSTDENTEDEKPTESDGEKNGNPFESILDEIKKEEEVSMESMITSKLGLNPGELSNFINSISNKMLAGDMKTIFDTYGPESAEMSAARELYKNRSTEMAQGILNSIIVFESIGIPFDNSNIKYPDLFI